MPGCYACLPFLFGRTSGAQSGLPPPFPTVFFPAMADIVLPSLVCNDDVGPGLDDDCSMSHGEAGDIAELEDCFARSCCPCVWMWLWSRPRGRGGFIIWNFWAPEGGGVIGGVGFTRSLGSYQPLSRIVSSKALPG